MPREIALFPVHSTYSVVLSAKPVSFPLFNSQNGNMASENIYKREKLKKPFHRHLYLYTSFTTRPKQRGNSPIIVSTIRPRTAAITTLHNGCDKVSANAANSAPTTGAPRARASGAHHEARHGPESDEARCIRPAVYRG